MKTSKFTEWIESDEWYGDNDFHNHSFTISVGWQSGRKNIVKENVPIENEEDTVKN